MDILIVSSDDACRSRIAKALFEFYGKGIKVSTAGIAEASMVPDVVINCLNSKGYDISRKKPVSLSSVINEHWDMIISLCDEASKELSFFNNISCEVMHFNFDAPLANSTLNEAELEEEINAVYEDMYRTLYEFYRDVVSERLMPRCSCGANDFCRCE